MPLFHILVAAVSGGMLYSSKMARKSTEMPIKENYENPKFLIRLRLLTKTGRDLDMSMFSFRSLDYRSFDG